MNSSPEGSEDEGSTGTSLVFLRVDTHVWAIGETTVTNGTGEWLLPSVGWLVNLQQPDACKPTSTLGAGVRLHVGRLVYEKFNFPVSVA